MNTMDLIQAVRLRRVRRLRQLRVARHLPTWGRAAAAASLALLLSACATPVIEEARQLEAHGQHEQALLKLRAAAKTNTADADLRSALAQQTDIAMADLHHQFQAAHERGDIEGMQHVLDHARRLIPQEDRVQDMAGQLDRVRRHQRILSEVKLDVEAKNYERAEAALRTVVNEDPNNAQAAQQLAKVEEMRESQVRQRATLKLSNGDKKITLEFRDASLKSVFEALSRAANLNFVFDKDVRSDAKVTLFLHGTTVEEALRVIVTTQQLNYKMLNASTLMVFPATQQKQRDILDTVTRAFYLTNTDAKQAQALVRTVAKSRDIFVDDRLNLMVVRDTPDAMRLIERLVQSLDVADPEVMMDVEVLEVSKATSLKLGVTPPGTVSFGTTGASTTSTTSGASSVLQIIKPDPLVTATATASDSDSKLLASPKIRARNHEKAKVLLGEKLPVFTTSSTPTNGTTLNAVSINYLDVGVKLEVEPQVQSDNDVVIKLNLEVSSITNTIDGPDSSVAYQVGTRQATTSLRLRDGETQVLAGLINNTESHSMAGLPFLKDLPLLGRLFGLSDDETSKTQVVLLITPHVIRGLQQPAIAATAVPSGTDSMPGAPVLSLSEEATTGGLGGQGTGSSGGSGLLGQGDSRRGAGGPALGPAVLGPEEVMPGTTFMVSVRNPSGNVLAGSLSIDPSVLSFDGKDATGSRIAVSVPPGGSQSVLLHASKEVTDAQTMVETDFPSQPLNVRVRSAQAAANSSADEGAATPAAAPSKGEPGDESAVQTEPGSADTPAPMPTGQ